MQVKMKTYQKKDDFKAAISELLGVRGANHAQLSRKVEHGRLIATSDDALAPVVAPAAALGRTAARSGGCIGG